MKHIHKRLTYANVMSTIAVFLVLGGATALAAGLAKNSVGSKQLKKNAVVTAKIKNGAINAAKLAAGSVGTAQLGAGAVTSGNLADNAVANSKLADNAVTNSKLATNAVSATKIAGNAVETGKLADSAVTAGKLAEGERSEAFQSAVTSGEVALPAFASAAATVATITLPAGGHYVVTGETEMINTDIVGPTSHYAVCSLVDEGTSIGEQATSYSAGGLAASGGVTITGVASGGTITLVCKADDATHSFAFQRRIVATRVGSVTG